MHVQLRVWWRKLRAIAYFIFNIAQFISALLAIMATSFGAAVIAWVSKHYELTVPLIAFGLGVLTTSTIVMIALLRASPTRWLLRGYRLINAEYSYRFHDDDPNHHSATITVLLEALRPGVDHFESRYLWSGKGLEKEPEILSPGHKLLGPPIQRGIWKYYYVHFGRELAVGERIEIRIHQELYDKEGTFEPFIAKVIAEPIDHLVVRGVFSKNRLPSSEIMGREMSAMEPTGALVRKMSCRIDPESGEVRWDILSPVLGHNYELRWRW